MIRIFSPRLLCDPRCHPIACLPLARLCHTSQHDSTPVTPTPVTPPLPPHKPLPDSFNIAGNTYHKDEWTNITPRIVHKIGRNLHNQQHHPINLIRQRIVNFFYSRFTNMVGNPSFVVFDSMNPVVTVEQNFDSLLVPKDHSSRSKTDTYYINKNQLLRAHTSAHQEELIKMGFDQFLVVGDVYRRDEIDSSHYPVFHQMEGVRLLTKDKVFAKVSDPTDLDIFETSPRRCPEKQKVHTLEAVKLLEHNLKTTLLGVATQLFGKDIRYRWVDCYFPFTHPSWELEVEYQGDWMEVLGCGIIEQRILNTAGASHQVGWAFGLGLERLAMKLYGIPDIRLFWSEDPGFARQFNVDNVNADIKYKPVSQFPPCVNDIAFWLPEPTDSYSSNDFYDLVRTEGGDVIEQVSLVDEFTNPKSHRTSHCYRIVYRHMHKTFTQEEVNTLHFRIADMAKSMLGVELRMQ